MTDGHELKIPHPPDWARERVDALFGFVSRGTAPVYVEHSSTCAIGQRCVTEQGFSASRARPHSVAHLDGVVKPKRGDLLLNSTGTGTIGRSCVFDQDGDFIVDGHVTLLQPLVQRVDSRWFDAILRSSWGQSFLETRCYSGSTNQVELSKSLLCSATVPVPPLVEQRSISKLLGLVTEAIGSTEQLVEKLKLAKQGLRHDLLTRGLDDNGELRDPIRHPGHFQDSSVGKIPKLWQSKVLNELIDPSRPIIYGILMPGHGFPNGVPVVKVKDIRNGKIDCSELLLTSPALDYEYRRSRLLTGDLLFTIRGTVGRMAFVPPELDAGNITQDTVRISVRETYSSYIRHWLEMPEPRRFIEINTIGVAVKGINVGDVRRIPVACPPLAEAKTISGQLDTAEREIELERERFGKLRLLKQALMDDLLTGRVRVIPLLEKDSPL